MPVTFQPSATASSGGNPPQVSHARVARLALPMTLAHMTTPLLGVADAAVIGRLGQAHLLGAIAASAIIFDFIFWSCGFLRMGTAGLTAQALGAGDSSEQRATLLRALIVGLFIGAAMICLQAPIAWIGFGALAASPEVTDAGRLYFNIRIWSAPFALANYAVMGAIVGRGRTDIALALQVMINLGNIGLNIAFVYGLSLGVQGSAAGTLAAEVLGALGGLFVVWRMYRDLFSVPCGRVFDREKIARMFVINRDIFVRNTALLFAFAFFTAQGARGGDIVLAGNAILQNLVLVAAFFLDGFATAAEQMCGQSIGARDAASFHASVRLTALWCFIFAAGLSVAALLFGDVFIAFLTTNPHVRIQANEYLMFAALVPLVGALAYEFDGVFIGATWTRDMRNMMLLSLAVYLASFMLLRPLGNTGLWLSLLLFLAMRGLSLAWRYRKLSALSFPVAQSGAITPIASASRG
ncbi:MATE family efflux transporter [Methylocapsa sp. D3K7]|uniref:MATE family efflux transporter n=1 Tax=Methylocapsa sp. D3K7 TaxID=3041435 RepID=UPI00244E7703|nr:MATE family efflux transporter [Methylocapsa sp. D3K7]WGJ16103.1 MATE family efflux transporter [Methylocapsa sp. D3K7]